MDEVGLTAFRETRAHRLRKRGDGSAHFGWIRMGRWERRMRNTCSLLRAV